MTLTTPARPPLKLGLFDIMQVDPLRAGDIAAMYRERLDDLAFADDLGLDVAFCAERHFLPPFAAASATAWLAAASQRTSRMRLGAMAFTLPIKAPVELAEDIATLDLLTGGRLEVGFGTGHRVEELAALGVDPAQRISLFQERLALVRALLTGGSVSFERGDLRIRQVAISPLSIQEPHPPLWYAGTDPMASQWMGANGMGLAVGFKPTDQLAAAVAAFNTGRDARSEAILSTEPDRPLGAVALMRSVIVGESDEQVRSEIADDLVRLEDAVSQEPPTGDREQRLQAATVQIETMLKADVMLAGSVETVAAGIRRSREALGFDLFLASPYAMGASQEQVRTTMQLLAGPVREALRN